MSSSAADTTGRAPGSGRAWTVPGYTEVRVLGGGGFGEVVLAVHDASGTPVAVKYLHPDLLRDPGHTAMFRAEARTLAGVESPHVVRLYEYAEGPAGAAIVMELVEGVTLAGLLEREGRTTPEAALAVLYGSLLGLAAAHARGVVHRDYKPANVLIDGRGASKLTDFGVAVLAGDRPAPAGTLRYMPPEQFEGARASPAADVYAATVTFYQCLAGRVPFDGQTAAELYDRHRSAAVPMDPVPEPLRPVIARGMAKDPRYRPSDAGRLAAELRAVAAAGYGEDWEDRGRSHLAEAALALLALLWPSGAAPAAQGITAAKTPLTEPAKHPGAGHPEAGHPEAGHPEAGHPGSAHSEPGHPQSGHSELGHPESGHSQAGHSQPWHSQVGHSPPDQPPASQETAHQWHLRHVLHEEHQARLRAERSQAGSQAGGQAGQAAAAAGEAGGAGGAGQIQAHLWRGDQAQPTAQRLLRRVRAHPVAAAVVAGALVVVIAVSAALASSGGGSSPSASSGPIATSIAGLAPSSAAPDPAPDPAADPAPSAQCVFQQASQAGCTSSDPEITVEDTNYGDTSGCVLSAQVTWGDGSQQTVQYQGADNVPSFVASHTYQQQGTYSISFAPTVVSGNCKDTNSSYTFTYSQGG